MPCHVDTALGHVDTSGHVDMGPAHVDMQACQHESEPCQHARTMSTWFEQRQRNFPPPYSMSLRYTGQAGVPSLRLRTVEGSET